MFGFRIWSLADREAVDDELWDAMKAAIDKAARERARNR